MTKLKRQVVKMLTFHRLGKKVFYDDHFIEAAKSSNLEIHKQPRRTEIINYFVKLVEAKNYLEIGVRNPKKNFDRIICQNKYSVDPGIEFKENPVNYKMTSDSFFEKLKRNELDIDPNIKFDVIFLDGLHISNQVDRDINNSLEYISDEGLIILHDCNPPTEYHQRETHEFFLSPARNFWNGTTWKAFYKARHYKNLYSICFDSDWGVGVLSKKQYHSFNRIESPLANEFYEYAAFNENRKEHMNLHSFEEWKGRLN